LEGRSRIGRRRKSQVGSKAGPEGWLETQVEGWLEGGPKVGHQRKLEEQPEGKSKNLTVGKGR